MDNYRRVGVVGVCFVPVREGRDWASRVSKTVGEAGGVGGTAVKLWEEEVGEDLRGQSGSKEERTRCLKLMAEDREWKSGIQVVKDMRRERVGGQSFRESNAAGVVGTEAVGEGNAKAVAEASWTDRRKGFAAREVRIKNESGGTRIVGGGADDGGDRLRVESRSKAMGWGGGWGKAEEAVGEGIRGWVDTVSEPRWINGRRGW